MPNLRTLAPAAAALVLLGGCTGTTPSNPPATTTTPPATPGAKPAGGLPDLVEQLGPSVVTVTVATGLGSGVVLKPDVIVTNRHVVTDQKQVSITYADGTRSAGTVLATDQDTDLAVIRTDRKNLPVPSCARTCPAPASPSWRSAARWGSRTPSRPASSPVCTATCRGPRRRALRWST